MTRKIFITICLVTLFSVIASAGDNNSNTPLRFSKDGKFKIFAYYTLILGIATVAAGFFENSVGMTIPEYIAR